MEAHPPVVGLVAGKTGAVDTGLLASAEADHLAVVGVAHRVALGVLEGDGGDSQVTSSALGESTGVLGGDDGGEGLGRNLDIVAVLLELDAVDASGLGGGGVVLGVDLENEVLAALLLLEDGKGSLLVARGNDTVGDLLGDDAGGGNIHNIAEGNDVAKAAHAISTAGTSVGLSQTRGLNALDVVDKVDLALLLGEGQANGSTGGGDVLEAGSSGLAQSLLQLLDQRPGVEGVEEVDVAGRAAEDLEGQLALGDVGSSGLLVRVSAISQRHELVAIAGVLLAEELGDGGVVVGSVLKGLEGVSVAAGLGDLALLELSEEASVVVGVAEDGDSLVVLGSGSDEGNAANVNLLDSLGDADVDLGDSVLEGVEVADDVVDLVDVLLSQVLFVRGEVPSQDTSVDGGVERLDPAGKHLGSLGDGRDVSRKQASAKVSHGFFSSSRSFPIDNIFTPRERK